MHLEERRASQIKKSRWIHIRSHMAQYNAQPTWNVKCIALTLVIATGYWFLPVRNKWVLLALVTLPYLALAWYDHMYGCEHTMGPTYLSLFYIWFKPQRSKQIEAFRTWDPRIKRRVVAVDAVILMLVIASAPAFLRWNPAEEADADAPCGHQPSGSSRR